MPTLPPLLITIGRKTLEQIQDQYLEFSLDHQQGMDQIKEQSRHHDWGLEL